MESFKALYKVKKYFYLKNNDNRIPEIEEMRLKSISNKYHLNGIYYDLDNHNIFKRKDRFRFKKLLIAIFLFLVVFNIFEIIFNIIRLSDPQKSEDFDKGIRLITSFISLSSILVTLILSSSIIIKMKIESSIFY